MNKKKTLTLLVVLCLLIIGTLIWTGCRGETPSAKPDPAAPSTEANEPGKPADPADPVAPVDPANPTDPVTPVDPANPTDPADPVDPTDPDDPVEPGDEPGDEPGEDDEPEYYVDENGNLVIVVPGDQGSGGL